MKTCRVTIADTGHILLDRAEVALGAWARLKGLMGRKRLPPSEGMLLPRCNSVHTVFMREKSSRISVKKKRCRTLKHLPACRAPTVHLHAWDVTQRMGGCSRRSKKALPFRTKTAC